MSLKHGFRLFTWTFSYNPLRWCWKLSFVSNLIALAFLLAKYQSISLITVFDHCLFQTFANIKNLNNLESNLTINKLKFIFKWSLIVSKFAKKLRSAFKGLRQLFFIFELTNPFRGKSYGHYYLAQKTLEVKSYNKLSLSKGTNSIFTLINHLACSSNKDPMDWKCVYIFVVENLSLPALCPSFHNSFFLCSYLLLNCKCAILIVLIWNALTDTS